MSVAAVPPDLVDYPANLPGVLDLGHRHFALRGNAEGTRWLWWHDCPDVEHISWGWVGAGHGPDDEASGHVVVSADPLTVRGSLVCRPGCGDHGLVEGGRWRPL